MNAVVITIGDELLIGQVINTNQAYIAQKLNETGIAVARMITVGDIMPDILASFHEAWKRYDVVIVTGGLGPTHDDITKKAVCDFFDSPLEFKEELRTHIQGLLQRRGIPWKGSHEEQCLFPTKARSIPNPLGTAAGFHFEDHAKYFFVLPGVPYEMKAMVQDSVVPYLAERTSGSVIRHRTLRTTGASESLLASMIGDVGSFLGDATLAFLPSPCGVRLRVSVRTVSAEVADTAVEAIERLLRQRVGQYVYGIDDEELEAVVGALLVEHHLSIAVAESCTGGMIANKITNVSGSSQYFERGVIAYSDAAKSDILGVPSDVIILHGAVSREVAEAMAAGIRKHAGTSIGISTTGIAGPTGGSSEKPVGLVWIGYSDEKETTAFRFQFGDERLRTKERATAAALELVRRKVLRREL